FFSSRRRHTRFSRDWSSDVCSSDLQLTALSNAVGGLESGELMLIGKGFAPGASAADSLASKIQGMDLGGLLHGIYVAESLADAKIGRASCRERGQIAGVPVSCNRRT